MSGSPPPSSGEHPGLAGTLFQTNWVPLPEQAASFVLSERGPLGDPQRQRQVALSSEGDTRRPRFPPGTELEEQGPLVLLCPCSTLSLDHQPVASKSSWT